MFERGNLMVAFFAIIANLGPPPLHAQGGFIDQSAAVLALTAHAVPLELIPDMDYRYQLLSDEHGNNVVARNMLYKSIGDGDAHLGRQRSAIVQLLNRRAMVSYEVGDTVIVPTRYDVDFRTYSPFPVVYNGGKDFDTLIILDKTLQAFAAYEGGELVRWGIINTGNPAEAPTPNGRYNVTWREPNRVSGHNAE